jgi:hypothetical protein
MALRATRRDAPDSIGGSGAFAAAAPNSGG